ncbi:MAG TPA: glycosyltransferase family 2 protein [Actinomycetota bacterium]|nr:glycosyltransferase family 2 protein [Actinomycetota bacterium]
MSARLPDPPADRPRDPAPPAGARGPDLAVVVVNHDAGPYLERCLRSVLAAAGGLSLEVVVVDNASTDGSERAAELAGARLIRNPHNRGFSAAANQGIRATSAPWVLLLNPDAEVWAGTLAALLKRAEDDPRVAVVGPLLRNADGTVYPSGRRIPSLLDAVGHAFLAPFWPGNPFTRRYRIEDWDRTTEREVPWVSGAAMLLRRRAVEEVGLLDEGYFLYFEELDLCTRLRERGWRVLFTPELEVLHEGGVSTGRSRRMHLIHSRSAYRYFAKHRARGWRRALLPLARAALRARAELVALRDARRSR